MKLLRFGDAGAERTGIIDADGNIRDATAIVPGLAGANLGTAYDLLRETNLNNLPFVNADGVRIAPCVSGVGKIVCVGRNYADHAKETGQQTPEEPILFLKATSAITGAYDPIELPQNATQLDWEVELGVVMAHRAKDVSEEEALRYVCGYCVINDVSEREFQKERGGQWTKGKSHDTFAPLGPWLVTRDEIPDPHTLSLWTEVDGVRYQDGSTRDMMFKVSHLISYISQFMTLEPGDIIATGTPSGVGLGQKPPVFLRAGQTVRMGVEHLGVQEHQIVSA